MRSRIATAVLVFLLCLVPLQADSRVRHILLVHSWHQGFPWTDHETDGIHQVLSDPELPFPVEIHHVDLDLRRFPDGLEGTGTTIDAILAKVDISLILTTDNPAFDLMTRHPVRLQKNIPLVFCGVNDFRKAMQEGVPQATGVAENFLSGRRDTIRAARALQPLADRCLFLLDTSATSEAIAREIQAMKEDFPDVRFVFMVLEDLSAQERLVAGLSMATILFPVGIHRDDEGNIVPYSVAMERISAASRVPCYGFIEDRVGHGMAGGKILTGADHGAAAASMAVGILQGIDPSAIPVVTDNPGRYIFDQAVLDRFGLDASRLPPDTLLLHPHFDFLSENGPWLLALLTIILLLAALVITLLLNRRRLLSTQRDLKDHRARLSRSLQEKEVLLRELYHRTKNNLYVTQSLLLLHAGDDPEGRSHQVLTDMAQRINAMALVHQILYETNDLSAIPMPDFLRQLMSMSERSHEARSVPVESRMDCTVETLPLDIAVPLGMVAHEMLANAWRHAFGPAGNPDGFRGVLHLSLQKEGGDHLTLRVTDNGRGTVREPQAEGMGITTMRALVESQLFGRLELMGDQGMTCTAVLPLVPDTIQKARGSDP